MVVLLSEWGVDPAKGLTSCNDEAVLELSGFLKASRYDPKLISYMWLSSSYGNTWFINIFFMKSPEKIVCQELHDLVFYGKAASLGVHIVYYIGTNST